jgi:hypothetical protein
LIGVARPSLRRSGFGLSVELLEDAFDELKKDAAPGVDRLTWED